MISATDYKKVSIEQLSSKLSLDVPGSNRNAGTGVIIWDFHGGSNQIWELTDDGHILSSLNGFAITAGGTEAHSFNNKLTMQPVDPNDPLQTWELVGKYTIKLRDHNLCLDSPWNSTSRGTELQAQTCNGTDAQKWQVEDLTDTQAVSAWSSAVSETDWVAVCQQNRTSFLAAQADQLPHCLVTADFSSAKECFKCESGYTYDDAQHCITLADAEAQGVCTSLTGRPVGTDECSYCDGGKGAQCGEGEALVKDGTCVPEIANCDNQDCDGVCLECVNGYYLAQDKNVCVKAIEHCKDQGSEDKCINCKDTYVEVVDDLCCPSIHNCKVQGDTCGVCDQICDQDQIENHNKVCVDIIEHCENQHDNGDCHFCESGYKLAVDNARVCVEERPHCVEYQANGDCETCKNGQQLLKHDTALDICVPIIVECDPLEYEQPTGKCNGCNPGFELAQDLNVCVPTIPNCCAYHSSATCFSCCTGQLKLSPQECREDIPHCSSYACNGACDACEFGYVQLAGKCSPEVPYCDTYNSNGTCSACISEYQLNGRQCQHAKQCASFSCDGTCVKCADGNTLTEYGVCTSTSNQIVKAQKKPDEVIELNNIDYNGSTNNEIWKYKYFVQGVAGGQLKTLEMSLKGKDQGWGNKKSMFAVSVDTLGANFSAPAIGEWNTFTYEGMIAVQTSPIFEHSWNTYTPDLQALTDKMDDPNTTYYIRFWTKAGGGGGHSIHIKNIKGYAKFN